MTNHCAAATMLKPLHQYVGASRWEYTTEGRNPSANICLIIGSTWRTTEGGAGFISNAVAAHRTARLAWQPSGVIDDTNSKSYWAFVLRRSMKCLYSPPKSESDPSWKQRRRLPCNRLKKHGASEGCAMCAYGNPGVFLARMRSIFVPFISNLVQLFDMEMFEVTVQLILKALSGSLTDKPWEHKGVNEMGNWG